MHESFGEPSDGPDKKPPGMFVGRRCVNAIEVELEDMLACALAIAPVAFIDEDHTLENAQAFPTHDDGSPLTVAEAKMFHGIVAADVAERFRRQIAIARDCGPDAPVSLYVAACESVGVNPWPNGEKLT